VTTGDKYEEDMYDNGLIVARKGDLKTYQKIIAVGSSVRDIKEGDQVMINVMNYAVRKYNKNSIQNDMDNNPVLEFKFNWITMDDEDGNSKECLLLNDRDVLFAFEGEEKNERLIVPDKPKVIVN
jgi:threonine dehydrogenase-like Zn-dependent dehydrogenase